jgi:hypothetical protein
LFLFPEKAPEAPGLCTLLVLDKDVLMRRRLGQDVHRITTACPAMPPAGRTGQEKTRDYSSAS